MQRLVRIWPALLATLVIAAAAVGALSPALFGGKILAPLDITTRMLTPWKADAHAAKAHNHYPSDAITQYLPYRIHAEKSLREDGYIGWNPYTMGGSSLAANTMALPASWTMQLHRFLPFEQAWNIGLLAEFIIAGSGMLLFLRTRGLPWFACVLGALVYMGNSQFIIWIYHRWALSSFSWMPWVLWASADGITWKNPHPRLLLLPVFLTLAFLGSTLQHLVFVGLACGCLFAGGIPDLKSTIKQWPSAIGWSVAFFLAVAIAAFTLVPQVQAYFTNVSIGHTRGGIGYAEGPTQPILNLVAIPVQIWPWLLGDPQTIDAWRLLKSNFMNLAYIGTVPMVLAAVGLFMKSMPRQAKWLILVGLLIPISPLVGPLYHRVQLLFLLGGSWMAAEMLARLPSHSPRFLVRGVTAVVLAIGAALLIGTCLPAKVRDTIERTVVSKSLAATANSNFGHDPAWVEKRAIAWTDRFSLAHPRTAWIYGLLLAGTTGLILASRRQTAWGNTLIIGASSLELLTLFHTWTTFSDPHDLLPPHAAIQTVRQASGADRVLQYTPQVLFSDVFASPNLLSAYLIPSVDAYESIQYRSINHSLSQESPETRLSLAGVGLSVQPTDTPPQAGTTSWPVVEITSGFTLRKNPTVPPRLAAGHTAPPTSAITALSALSQAEALTPTEQTMNHRTFRIPPGSSWVRLSENWHPGWRWRIPGGIWSSFLPGPDSACWIDEIPADTTLIEARFLPRSIWLSTLSLLSLIGWFGLATISLLTRCKESALPPA